MKKIKNKEILILLVLSLLLIIPLSTKNTSMLDDKLFHLLRIDAIADAFKNGEYFPRIYTSLIYGYGYGSPLFYPDIFIYIPALLVSLGLNVTIVYDINIFIINIATAFISYYSYLKISNSKSKALWFSFMYLYFPYRLYNLFIRNAVGELLATIFFPLFLLFLCKFIKKKKCDWKLLTITFFLVLNSHLISLYLMTIVLLITCITNYKIFFNKKILLNFIKASISTVFMGGYFLFPMLEQLFSQSFYFNKSSAWGSISTHSYEILRIESNYLKVFITILSILILILIINHIKLLNEKGIKTLIIISFLTLLLVTNIVPWDIIKKIPLIENVQFPWRLFSIVNITIPIIIIELGYLLNKKFQYINLEKGFYKKTTFIAMLLPFIYIVCFMFGYTQVQRNIVLDNSLIYGSEYLPINYKLSYIADNIYYCGSSESSYSYERINNYSYLNTENKKLDKSIEVPLTYYKGYKAYLVNDKNNKVLVGYNKNGLVELSFEKPTNSSVKIIYENTYVQKISFAISIISIIAFISMNIKQKRLD